eukprot:115922_1
MVMYIISQLRSSYLIILFQYILSALIFNNLYTKAEYIINPGPNSTITCGTNEPCHIICNDTQICIGSTFNVFNTITIKCSGKESCLNSTIQTTNINTLYALFNGESAFVQSTFISSPNDKNVTINCNALYACEFSSFYHSADTVTHLCKGESSCSHSVINSTYNDAFSLICDEQRSCSGLCDNSEDRCSSRCPVDTTKNPCPSTDVTIYSNDIYIKCSDTKSCAELNINLHNFTSLITEFTGQFTFSKGILTATSNKTDSIINTRCTNNNSCDQAYFYHYGNSSVYHLCNYYQSCVDSNIQSETYYSFIDCYAASSCKDFALTVINGVNKLLCTGDESCNAAYVYPKYVESMYQLVSGKLAFASGGLETQDNDNDISLICDGIQSCKNTRFIYNASGVVTHECNGVQSCRQTDIISFIGATITCNATKEYSSPCEWSTLVMPFDFDEFIKFKLIIIGEYTALGEYVHSPFQIYSLFGIQSNIMCIDCNNAYDNVVVIYGLKFNKFCWLNDGCLDDIFSNLEYRPDDIEILSEYKPVTERNWTEHSTKLDYSEYVVSKQHAVLVTVELPSALDEWNSVIYPPQMPSENSWFSIIILDRTTSGNDVDMSSINNAILTLTAEGLMRDANIYGSSKNFIYNGFVSAPLSDLYINNTDYVQINGPKELKIFAGNVINLEIRCIMPYQDCEQVDIYSSINPILIPIFKNGWIFQCESELCTEFYGHLIDIHFTSINTDCSWTVTDPGCTFLTFDPTQSPTGSPSYSPTISPTFSPSITPTNSPSQPPSAAPTRYPTVHNAYSKKIRIDYTFSEINKEIIDIILNDFETVILIIERSYIIIAKNTLNHYLQYKNFEITINNNNIKKGDNKLVISTNIHYEDKSDETIIALVTRTTKFEDSTQSTFRQHYNNSNLLFTANIIPTSSNLSQTFDYMLPILISVMCIGVCISIAAFMYNKSSGYVDDAIHFAVMIYALQIFDFISDVNLSFEIVSQFNINNENSNDKLLLYIAGYGTILFIVLPYTANVLLTCRIRKYVKNNSSALVYFSQRSTFFVVLVILCGGTYAALQIVSSRLFGYEILNSGLTQFELRQLSNIKLFGNVLLENVPQLICQIIYISYIGTITNNATLSFFASSCSIIAAVVTWLVERRTSESFVVQYDLEMVKKYKNIMSESQREAILKKKECKKSLRKLITSSIKIPETTIELGYVTVTATGCVVHCIHYTLKSELKRFIQDSNGTMVVDDDENSEHEYILASKRLTQQIYRARRREVNVAFVKHFDFDIGTFHVNYIRKFGYNNLISKRNLLNPLQLDIPDHDEVVPDDTPQDSRENNEFEQLDGIDFTYQKIVSLGIMIKDLLKHNMSYEYIKESLMEKGYGENVINLWLKWYKFKHDSDGDLNQTEGDGYNDDEKHESEFKRNEQYTEDTIVSNVNNKNIIHTDDGKENEIEIEMQIVMRDNTNDKMISKYSSSSFKSDNESDYNRQYGTSKSTKL